MESQLYRPRTTTEILDASFQIFKRHYVPLLVLSAVAYAPMLIATIWLQSAMEGAAPDAFPFTLFGFFLLALLFFLVAEVAMLVGASDGYTDGRVAPADALGLTLRRSLAILAAVVLKWVVIILPLVMAGVVVAAAAAVAGGGVVVLLGIVVAGGGFGLMVFLVGRLVAVPSVTVLERLGPIRSMQRSFELTEGRWLNAVGVIALAYLVIYAIAMVVTIAGVILTLVIAGDAMLGMSLGNFSALFFYPFLAVATIVLYYDLRIRREGYDVELMARALEEQPTVPQSVR